MNNAPEYVLYGCRPGSADWEEIILTVTLDPSRVEAVKVLAARDGFDRLRVAVHNPGELPDFAAAVLTPKRPLA